MTLKRLLAASQVCLVSAALIVASWALPNSVQAQAPDGQPTESLFPVTGRVLQPLGCLTGIFVPNARENPDLVSDCQKLVSIRNHWTGQFYNSNLHPSHPILSWGQSETRRIQDWEGIYVRDGRVTEISLAFDYNLKGYFPLKLSGTIPAELAQLTELTSIDLSRNYLLGEIPPELAGLSQLRELRLDGNILRGTIPEELSQLSNLQTLTLSNNMLSGPIPAEFGSFTNLLSLGLQGNQLSGPIPAEIATLPLDLFLFCENSLSGQLPEILLNRIAVGQLISDVLVSADDLTNSPAVPQLCEDFARSAAAEIAQPEIPDEGNTDTPNSENDEPAEGDGLPEAGQPSGSGNGDGDAGGDNSDSNDGGSGDSGNTGGNGNNNGSGVKGNNNGDTGDTDTSDTGNSPASETDGAGPGIPIPDGLGPSTDTPANVVWRLATVRVEDATSDEIFQDLDLPDNGVLWQWDAEAQEWRSYIKFSPTRSISQGTTLAFRTSADLASASFASLGPTNEEVTLELQNGWNILAAPQDMSRPAGETGAYFMHDQLVNCGQDLFTVLAVLHLDSASGSFQVELPCNADSENRLLAASNGYGPVDTIQEGDGIFVLYRTILPVTITWDPTTDKYLQAS